MARNLAILDNRGLASPEPLMRTLAWLEEGMIGTVITDRPPLLLYDELAVRGYLYTVEERPDGYFVHIRRNP
ncbi:MAG: DUF2249 domain-containing protein [Thermaerobacter sp.]|nr:DUF2249 domain-containing protein [Thermaerobacter sp.]